MRSNGSAEEIAKRILLLSRRKVTGGGAYTVRPPTSMENPYARPSIAAQEGTKVRWLQLFIILFGVEAIILYVTEEPGPHWETPLLSALGLATGILLFSFLPSLIAKRGKRFKVCVTIAAVLTFILNFGRFYN